MMTIRNKLVKRYVAEIQNLEQKIRNIKLKKSEVVLSALEQYYISLIKEILENHSKEEIEKLANDKELLKRHLII
jgi:predicted house-cleaning noncanonical NTP pyrophosphatase (MazG superfamily)